MMTITPEPNDRNEIGDLLDQRLITALTTDDNAARAVSVEFAVMAGVRRLFQLARKPETSTDPENVTRQLRQGVLNRVERF